MLAKSIPAKAFKDICRSYAPVVVEFSIDECFMDMTGTGHIYPDPVVLAHTIKDRIRDELGFTVNIDIGRSKLCAEMASDFEKPDKVHTIYPEEIPDKPWPLSAGYLLFVGGASAPASSRANRRPSRKKRKFGRASDLPFLKNRAERPRDY